MYLLIFLVILPVLEIAVLINVGKAIGVINTILIIILTGMLGGVLTRIQGFVILRKINERLSQGVMPSEEILDGALLCCGGVCLLSPGLIGDGIGCVLLIPWTRFLIRKVLVFLIRRQLKTGKTITVVPLNRSKIVDV